MCSSHSGSTTRGVRKTLPQHWVSGKEARDLWRASRTDSAPACVCTDPRQPGTHGMSRKHIS
eukprot:3806583-Rhodomonas_salina.1